MLLTPDGKELLNSSEAAELLSERASEMPYPFAKELFTPYTRSAIWSMCRRGVLKPYRIEGHTYLYLKDDIMHVPIDPKVGQRVHGKRLNRLRQEQNRRRR